jgi:hypothetical protein
MEVRAREGGKEQRCPFCHGDDLRGKSIVWCESCGAMSHTECVGKHGGCVGCGKPRSVETVDQRQKKTSTSTGKGGWNEERPGIFTAPATVFEISSDEEIRLWNGVWAASERRWYKTVLGIVLRVILLMANFAAWYLHQAGSVWMPDWVFIAMGLITAVAFLLLRRYLPVIRDD